MIVVIADDLTGAGEIGGIGLACGLKTEIQRQFDPETNAELLIIDTDSRSLPPQEAGQAMRDIAQRLKKSDLLIEWIYKKTDSVLRGPVSKELEALRDAMGMARVLLAPANPSKGRIVRNGNYFIKGKRLNETDFADDPEYPAATSKVLELPALADSDQIRLLTSDQRIDGEGILFGQAETSDDLLRWSSQIDRQTIPAGAGEFFEALLKDRGYFKKGAPDEKAFRLKNKTLFVCGSSAQSSRQILSKTEGLGLRVCRMPDELFQSADSENILLQRWSDQAAEFFENSRAVAIVIDRPIVRNMRIARQLRLAMGKAAQLIFQKVSLNELFVEGGATASEIVRCFDWNRFEPCDLFRPGVVRMKVLGTDHIRLTIKPGSYAWPEINLH